VSSPTPDVTPVSTEEIVSDPVSTPTPEITPAPTETPPPVEPTEGSLPATSYRLHDLWAGEVAVACSA
jgi:hypothetical protein